LSPEIRAHLSPEAQSLFVEKYNAAFDEANDANQAEQRAWAAVHEQYDEDESGVLSKMKVSA
jgi:cation transport regulator ChaB